MNKPTDESTTAAVPVITFDQLAKVEEKNRFVETFVPMLGGNVYIKRFTPTENAAFCSAVNDARSDNGADQVKDISNYCFLLLQHSLYNNMGQRIIKDAKPATKKSLMESGHGPAVDFIFEESQRINGFDDKTKRHLEKKSEAAT